MSANGEVYDLIVGNNVLAHVPDIGRFVAGLPVVLGQTGTITMEFPHLMRLLEHTQFDTIYHEHFSYLSLGTVCTVFEANGLKIYDVEELPTHGGSLRIYAAHAADLSHPITSRVEELLQRECDFGLRDMAVYRAFSQRASKIKLDTLSLLTALKQEKEARQQAEQQIEADRPKVLFAGAVSASHTSILIGDLAKLLKQNGYETGQKRLFQQLRDEGYLIKSGSSKNMPTQKAMEMGLFEVKETAFNNPDGTIRVTKTTKVTGKGQVYFINLYLGHRTEEPC